VPGISIGDFFLRAAVAVKVQASDARVAGYSTTSANYFFLPAFFAGARLRQSQNVLNFTELRAQFPRLLRSHTRTI